MKVMYHGEEIELVDSLDKGVMEQDMNIPEDEKLEKTIELDNLSILEEEYEQ